MLRQAGPFRAAVLQYATGRWARVDRFRSGPPERDALMFRALRANRGRVPSRAALRVVLPTADGKGTNAITEAIGKDKTAVWRWQERFMHEGIVGLTRDKTRPSRVRRLPAETVDRLSH
jgi:hypothetical protein